MLHRDCHDMPVETLFNTFPKFEKDLKQIFGTYKYFSDRQLAKVPHLVSWQDLTSIVTEDQQYRMSVFLSNKLVPENEQGDVC